MLDDYLKTNPGVKDLPRLGIEPQPPSPQSDAITIRPWRPHMKSTTVVVSTLNKNINAAPVPSITFCPALAFKNAGFQYTMNGYNENAFTFQDLFLNQTSESFNITSIDTAIRGRCYTLTQTNTVKKSQRVMIQMKAKVDTVVSLYLKFFKPLLTYLLFSRCTFTIPMTVFG